MSYISAISFGLSWSEIKARFEGLGSSVSSSFLEAGSEHLEFIISV